MSMKVESGHKIKLVKERISLYKYQAELNNHLNAQCRQVLNSLSQNTRPEKYPVKSSASRAPQKTNNLIKYVGSREHYIQHSNYWQQIWSFTFNPIYKSDQNEGFENPFYSLLNNKENSLKVIDMYESIYDLKNYKNSELDLISSPDSGIHSENLTRHNSEQSKCSSIQASQNGIDSLYSSIISSKKSSDNLCDYDDSDWESSATNVEQHELPLGWMRCCDEAGIYYWHKPSGTVTRKSPKLDLAPKKFDLDAEFEKSASISPQNFFDQSFMKNSISCSEFSSEKSECSKIRFYVRSLGWVRVNEGDLTPEKISQAVNKCINELSRGIKDFNDVVARWGEGKDLYMDIDDGYLVLLDPIDEKILNKQSIASIKVWGVGRDNGRDFAYVARDQQTKIHMCHVFRSDSGPAKEIANYLRDTCRHLIEEKRQSNSHISSNLKRPDYLPDLVNTTHKKIDINLKFKSVSYSNDTCGKGFENALNFPQAQEEPKKSIRCKYLGCTQVNKASGMPTLNQAIDKIYTKCLNEYKKAKREKQMQIFEQKMKQNLDDDMLNLNLEDVVGDDDVDDYDYDGENDIENSVSFDNLSEISCGRNLGSDVNVIISPSSIVVKKVDCREPSRLSIDSNDTDLIVECRLRYLSFMGISTDIRISGFIMQNADGTFNCHGFMCDNSSGLLCKTIEAACKLRYQKCLDAHPEAYQTSQLRNDVKNTRLASYLTSQLRNVFDNFRTKNLFSKTS
ncbi:amyloid beta A4 precursor -binding family B member 2-like isoform X1 [Brachionus plicatilis]|uniref:Amyloid beta A4-binding family B member 2-like isoform X1 n=1 Tax=Brachionus plicatilis TaxID=10195 RepID=A0A3M7PA16_BRAPC|nr:amyloid beta A4 precursor -binding family B member 2-like isoform X1 [Brachionus plicatilis]